MRSDCGYLVSATGETAANNKAPSHMIPEFLVTHSGGFHADELLSSAVLTRLFPWAPTDGDPWSALLWATGRGELPGREPVTSWRWHCAPLAEWDGTQPT